MNQEQLQAIRERVNKATPGPWEVFKNAHPELVGNPWGWIGKASGWQLCTWSGSRGNYKANIDFVSHAREDVPALLDEIERLRLPVRWFAEQMEAKLRANDHKGGWEQCDPRWLFDRLREEVTELAIELHRSCACRDSDCPHVLMTTWDLANKKRVIEEAADVANFALMIADIARQALAGEST